MNETTKPQRRSRRKGAVAIATVLMLLFSLLSPAASASEHTDISGTAVPSDCNRGVGAGAIKLTGDLKGCWIFFPQAYECQELNGFAHYYEEGWELFRGKFKGERGRFRTTYTLEATFTQGSCAEFEAGGFPYLKQMTGGCDHHIRGRRGVFKNMQGFVDIFDVIPDPGVSGASHYQYEGYLMPA